MFALMLMVVFALFDIGGCVCVYVGVIGCVDVVALCFFSWCFVVNVLRLLLVLVF